MAKFAPGQRQNRRLACVGWGPANSDPLLRSAPASAHDETEPRNTQAGSWPEHRLRSQFDRGAGAHLTQICGPRCGSDRARALKSLSSSRRCSPSLDLSSVAREGPGSIGQPDHLTMDRCREGDSRCLQSAGMPNLVKVGLESPPPAPENRSRRKCAPAGKAVFGRARQSGHECRRCRQPAARQQSSAALAWHRQVDRRAPGRRTAMGKGHGDSANEGGVICRRGPGLPAPGEPIPGWPKRARTP
jgi:hypothetical protein